MIDRLSEHLPLLQYAHLLWGFALFCCLAVWVYRPSRKRDMQHNAALILSDDNLPERGRNEHQA